MIFEGASYFGGGEVAPLAGVELVRVSIPTFVAAVFPQLMRLLLTTFPSVGLEVSSGRPPIGFTLFARLLTPP